MDGMEIFKQDVCRAALECNANLVVVYNGKKAFWYYEQPYLLLLSFFLLLCNLWQFIKKAVY